MKYQTYHALIVVLLFFAFSAAAHAENHFLVRYFGGSPGSALTHAYSYGLPEEESAHYKLRVAVIEASLKTVFSDTELTIARDGKIVREVRADRAYRTSRECESAREVVVPLLFEALPSTSERWQYQSSDGTIGASLACVSPRHYPMPVLRLEIVALP